MITIGYTAKRQIMAGHSSGSGYALTTEPQQFEEKVDESSARNRTLTGVRYVDNFFAEPVIDVETDFFEAADLPQWREFVYSVIGGEVFTIDDGGGAVSYVMTSPKPRIVRDGVFYKVLFEVALL